MRVAHQQSYGTLIGLTHGLLLAEARDRSSEAHQPLVRKLLLPLAPLKLQSAVSTNSSSDSSSSTAVVTPDLTALRSPPCYVYTLDERLQQLKPCADQHAVLYLALLHAATACALPDSLTGLTGTAAAMVLELVQLVPHRVYYPDDMRVLERVTWRAALPSYTAHEGLALAAEHLLRDSERLRAFFPGAVQPDSKLHKQLCKQLESRTGPLSVKAYCQQREQRDEGTRLTAAVEAPLLSKTATAAAGAVVCDYGPVFDSASSATASVMRALASSGHNWHSGPGRGLESYSGCVKAQLLALCSGSGSTLQGVTEAAFLAAAAAAASHSGACWTATAG
jgi:hypothetical protein